MKVLFSFLFFIFAYPVLAQQMNAVKKEKVLVEQMYTNFTDFTNNSKNRNSILYEAPPKNIQSIPTAPEASAELEEMPTPYGPPPKVEIIFDSSGSMGQGLTAENSRMYFAKKVLSRFLVDQWKERGNVGLRVYGSKEIADCKDTFLAINFGEDRLEKIESQVMSFIPKGRTPLYNSLILAKEDLYIGEGKKYVIVVTDGEDTCKGDPCAVQEEMKKDISLQARIFVVGLGVKAKSETEEKLKCMATENATQSLFMANDEKALFGAMGNIYSDINSERINITVDGPVPDAQVFLYKIENGKTIFDRSFTAGWGAIVPPGEYEAVVKVNPLYKFGKFKVEAGKKTVLKMRGQGRVTVEFQNKLLKVEVLDNKGTVIRSFNSDEAGLAPSGRWTLRISKKPFYTWIVPNFLVLPDGEHFQKVSNAGVLKVMTSQIKGLYVYEAIGKKSLLGNYITAAPIVLPEGSYTLHVDDKCSFKEIKVNFDKEIKKYVCPKK